MHAHIGREAQHAVDDSAADQFFPEWLRASQPSTSRLT